MIDDQEYEERRKKSLTEDVWIEFLLSVSVDVEEWTGRGHDGEWEGRSEITGADLRCPVCDGCVHVPSNPSTNEAQHRVGHRKDCPVLARLKVYFAKQVRKRSELVRLSIVTSSGNTYEDVFAGSEKELSISTRGDHVIGFKVTRDRDDEHFIASGLEAQSGTSGTCDVGSWSCDHVYPDRFVVRLENAPIGEKP